MHQIIHMMFLITIFFSKFSRKNSCDKIIIGANNALSISMILILYYILFIFIENIIKIKPHTKYSSQINTKHFMKTLTIINLKTA